jgi:hypothetical protein
VVVLLLSEYSSGLLSFSKEVSLVISLTQVLIWSVIAAVICFVGELLACRRAPDGILGTILLGLLAISLIVGIFHFNIPGEPFLGGIPLLSSIIAAALIGVWMLTKVIILTGISDINVAGVPLLTSQGADSRRNRMQDATNEPAEPQGLC